MYYNQNVFEISYSLDLKLRKKKYLTNLNINKYHFFCKEIERDRKKVGINMWVENLIREKQNTWRKVIDEI